MSARNRNYYRHPRTTQERRLSQDRFDLTIRGKRRNLPDSWDDIQKYSDKSWKRRRKTRYWPDKSNWAWRSYIWEDSSSSYKARYISETLERLGCYFKWTYREIVWYGPDIVKK